MAATTVNEAIEVLNRAFAADPDAIRALVSFRVPCNSTLADDPTIQVKTVEGEPRDGDHCEVGILGILNGIFGTREGARGGYIAWWPPLDLAPGLEGFGILPDGPR